MGLLHKIDNQKIDMTEEQHEKNGRHNKRMTRQKKDTIIDRTTCCVGLLSHHDCLLYAFICNMASCQQA